MFHSCYSSLYFSPGIWRRTELLDPTRANKKCQTDHSWAAAHTLPTTRIDDTSRACVFCKLAAVRYENEGKCGGLGPIYWSEENEGGTVTDFVITFKLPLVELRDFVQI